MPDKKLSFIDMMKTNIRGVRLCYSMIPWNLFLALFFGIVHVLLQYWNFFFLAILVDDAVAGAPWEILIKDTVILVAGWCILDTGLWALAHYYFYCGSNIWELANTHLNKKIMGMDYEYMESEAVQNHRRDIDSMARDNKDGGGINKLFWNIEGIIECSTSILVSFIYTMYLLSRCTIAFAGEPLKAALFIGTFVLLFAVLMYLAMWKNKSAQKKIYRKSEEMLPLFRQFHFYTEEYINKEECGKTIRMFHQQNLLSHHIEKLFKKLNNKNNDISDLSENRAEWLGVIETVISGLVYFLLGIMVLKKAITIGSVCLYAGCITNFMLYFRHGVSVVTDLASNTKYVKMYFDFLDIPNKKYAGTLPVEKRDDDKFEIEFRNVSFCYPGSEKYVLKDFSIKFNIGERLAVAGQNGSGKTTFIKLLCRLYDPSEGEILLNGINIKKYDYKEYLSLFSVVFQDFKIPAFSVGQNIAASMEYDAEKVKVSLRRAGLKNLLEKLPDGLDTMLYKDFDSSGIDISGGEAQKIAIARALYHDTPFVILDEPTAALDPLAEYEIYSKFDELVGSKTAVYISHRLSSCQFCNDILVIENGKAVQRGKHADLVKDKEGLYYKLWSTQAQYYQEQSV